MRMSTLIELSSLSTDVSSRAINRRERETERENRRNYSVIGYLFRELMRKERNIFIEAKREIGIANEGHHLIEFFLRQLQLTSSLAFSPPSRLRTEGHRRRKINHHLLNHQ